MTVPTTRENLHEADSLFNQSASHQTLFATLQFPLVQPIGVFCLLAFIAEVDTPGTSICMRKALQNIRDSSSRAVGV